MEHKKLLWYGHMGAGRCLCRVFVKEKMGGEAGFETHLNLSSEQKLSLFFVFSLIVILTLVGL